MNGLDAVNEIYGEISGPIEYIFNKEIEMNKQQLKERNVLLEDTIEEMGNAFLFSMFGTQKYRNIMIQMGYDHDKIQFMEKEAQKYIKSYRENIKNNFELQKKYIK